MDILAHAITAVTITSMIVGFTGIVFRDDDLPKISLVGFFIVICLLAAVKINQESYLFLTESFYAKK
jgi:hypothetical protein